MSKTLPTFANINDTAERTGISAWFIRTNMDKIPHIKSGKKYLIHVPKFEEWLLEQCEIGVEAKEK